MTTGVLLGGVLLVMVGEQAQEMQLAQWLPTTEISWLVPFMPDWMGMWFAVFPTWKPWLRNPRCTTRHRLILRGSSQAEEHYRRNR